MSRQEVAAMLGVTPQALSQMAQRGKGPRFLRVGRAIRYRPDDVNKWLESQTVTPAKERVQDTPPVVIDFSEIPDWWKQ